MNRRPSAASALADLVGRAIAVARESIRRRTAGILGASAAAILIVAGFTAASASPTAAAWTDRSSASATATAGTWKTDGCVAMSADGKPVSGGTCTIAATRFDQWSDGTNTVRDYYISVNLSEGSGYAAVSLDLSTAAGSGTWSWSKAATLPTGQFTPASGSSCSELPTLRVSGPTNWGTSYAFWVRIVQDKTVGVGSTRNCA